MKTYWSECMWWVNCPLGRKDERIPSVIISSRDVTNMIGNFIRFILGRKQSLIGCKRQKLPNFSRALLKISFGVVLNNGQVLRHYN